MSTFHDTFAERLNDSHADIADLDAILKVVSPSYLLRKGNVTEYE